MKRKLVLLKTGAPGERALIILACSVLLRLRHQPDNRAVCVPTGSCSSIFSGSMLALNQRPIQECMLWINQFVPGLNGFSFVLGYKVT